MSDEFKKEIAERERNIENYLSREDFTEYSPLPVGVDAIRILTIEPAGDFIDPLICSLTPIAFGAKPKFCTIVHLRHALSFFQEGDLWLAFPQALKERLRRISTIPHHVKLVPIIRNGQLFCVGPNLHRALQHLRSPNIPLNLLVDSICINQSHMDERNAQVSLMSFIYCRAIKVLAWLGTNQYAWLGASMYLWPTKTSHISELEIRSGTALCGITIVSAYFLSSSR